MPTTRPDFSPTALDDFDVLIVPGRGNSGPGHWQSYLEASLPGAQRVHQAEWDRPELDAWASRVAVEARRAGRPVLAVAHSFGCLATVAAILDHEAPITGALLVAPADPRRFAIAEDRLGERLPVPTTLVLSHNDPWLDAARARGLAALWGSRVVDAGYAGHINVDSGHGPWPRAHVLLSRLAGSYGTWAGRDAPDLARRSTAAWPVVLSSSGR